MATTRSSPAIELDGLSPEEAFRVLGNETRLEILRVLWNAGAHHEYDDVEDTARTISFSALRRAVDIRDNGKFNYHLGKLVPHFVRQTDGGYRLSGAGKQVARAVIAISGERNLDSFEGMETACPVCGGSLTVSYEDQWLHVACTDCPGTFGDAAPDGTIFHAVFPTAGMRGRSADDALTTGIYRCMMDLTYLVQGICRDCAGRTTASVSVCEDHEPRSMETNEPGSMEANEPGSGETHEPVTGEIFEPATGEAIESCHTCGTPTAAWADLRCDTCRFAKRLPVEVCVLGFTPVISFLYGLGVDVFSSSFEELYAADTMVETTVATDPLRVTVTIGDDTDELAVTVDDALTVVEIAEARG